MKNWLIAGAVVIGLAVVMFLSDRPQLTPSGVELVRGWADYEAAKTKAEKFGIGPMQKYMSNEPVTDKDKEDLKQSAKYFESMCLFEPRRVQPYFGWALCLLINGEKEKASEKLHQAVLNRDSDPNKTTDAVKLTVNEALGMIAEVDLDLAAEELANFNSMSQAGDKTGADAAKDRADRFYAEALAFSSEAIKANPNNYRHLVARGNVELALGQKKEAKEDIAKAYTLAPNDPRVRTAAKMAGL